MQSLIYLVISFFNEEYRIMLANQMLIHTIGDMAKQNPNQQNAYTQ